MKKIASRILSHIRHLRDMRSVNFHERDTEWEKKQDADENFLAELQVARWLASHPRAKKLVFIEEGRKPTPDFSLEVDGTTIYIEVTRLSSSMEIPENESFCIQSEPLEQRLWSTMKGKGYQLKKNGGALIIVNGTWEIDEEDFEKTCFGNAAGIHSRRQWRKRVLPEIRDQYGGDAAMINDGEYKRTSQNGVFYTREHESTAVIALFPPDGGRLFHCLNPRPRKTRDFNIYKKLFEIASVQYCE